MTPKKAPNPLSHVDYLVSCFLSPRVWLALHLLRRSPFKRGSFSFPSKASPLVCSLLKHIHHLLRSPLKQITAFNCSSMQELVVWHNQGLEIYNCNCEHEEFDNNRIKDLNITYDILSLLSSFDCGKPTSDVEFLSHHMLRNADNMRQLPSLQQKVVDYCMFNAPGQDYTEFANYGIFKISKTLQYLDNRKYTSAQQERFTGWAKMMANQLSVVLRELFDKRSSLIESLEVEVVPFDWQSKDNNLDCGVFMMLHMMFFKGSIFKSDLDKALKRRIYRSSICAAIVLHDLNEARSELLCKVEQLKLTKNDVMELAKRKK